MPQFHTLMPWALLVHLVLSILCSQVPDRLCCCLLCPFLQICTLSPQDAFLLASYMSLGAYFYTLDPDSCAHLLCVRAACIHYAQASAPALAFLA